jgi:hypothetical protein
MSNSRISASIPAAQAMVSIPKKEVSAGRVPCRSESVASSSSSAPSDVVSTPNRAVSEYLTQLLRDQVNLKPFGNMFQHLSDLLNEEIGRVRSKLLETISNVTAPLVLPEPEGERTTITRKVFFPKKQFPDFNFTGRILGPGGATIKRLEKEIGPGCTLAIRGKGSDPKADAAKASTEDQHVLVTINATKNRADLILNYAMKKIDPFLHPMDEKDDELKRSQMIELAIINGKYQHRDIPVPAQNGLQYMMAQLQHMSLTQQPQFTQMAPQVYNPNFLYSEPTSPMIGNSGGPRSIYPSPSPAFGAPLSPMMGGQSFNYPNISNNK